MFQPAPSPRLSLSTSRTSAARSRTNSTVPSLEPLSTTTVSTPRSESRQFSIHGMASYVTTTAATRCGSAMFDLGTRTAPEAVAQHDHRPRERQQQGHEEVQKTGCERLVGADADASEEAHEERLAHRDPVQRER